MDDFEKKLSKYPESKKAGSWVTQKAENRIDQLIEEKQSSKRNPFFTRLAFSTAAVLVIVLSGILMAPIINRNSNGYHSYYFSESDFYSNIINSVEEYDLLDIDIDGNNKYYIFKFYKTDEIAYIYNESNVDNGNFIDKITVYAVFTDEKINKFRYFESLNNQVNLYDCNILYETDNLNGVYMTSAYFDYGEITYYIELESYEEDRLNYYLDLLLAGGV